MKVFHHNFFSSLYLSLRNIFLFSFNYNLISSHCEKKNHLKWFTFFCIYKYWIRNKINYWIRECLKYYFTMFGALSICLCVAQKFASSITWKENSIKLHVLLDFNITNWCWLKTGVHWNPVSANFQGRPYFARTNQGCSG